MGLSKRGNGTTREENYLAASCDETNRTPEEDHSQIAGACTISRAECREKNLSATRRGGDISLDIPLYRTASVVPSLTPIKKALAAEGVTSSPPQPHLRGLSKIILTVQSFLW